MVFGSIQIGNLEKILQSFELPEETMNAIKMLIKNVKSYVRWADGDTKYFETAAGVLQGDPISVLSIF